jgi:hypothetical protein
MAPKVGEKGPAKKGPAKKAADGKAKKKKVSKAETYKIYIYSERLQGGWELPRFERPCGGGAQQQGGGSSSALAAAAADCFSAAEQTCVVGADWLACWWLTTPLV